VSDGTRKLRPEFGPLVLYVEASLLMFFNSVEIFPSDTRTPMVIEAYPGSGRVPTSNAPVRHVLQWRALIRAEGAC
jgi:hypothetical protein